MGHAIQGRRRRAIETQLPIDMFVFQGAGLKVAMRSWSYTREEEVSRLVLWPTANSNKVIPGRVICLCTRTRLDSISLCNSNWDEMTAGMVELQYYYAAMSCWVFTTRSRFYMCSLHERQILRQTTKSDGWRRREWSGQVCWVWEGIKYYVGSLSMLMMRCSELERSAVLGNYREFETVQRDSLLFDLLLLCSMEILQFASRCAIAQCSDAILSQSYTSNYSTWKESVIRWDRVYCDGSARKCGLWSTPACQFIPSVHSVIPIHLLIGHIVVFVLTLMSYSRSRVIY